MYFLFLLLYMSRKVKIAMLVLLLPRRNQKLKVSIIQTKLKNVCGEFKYESACQLILPVLFDHVIYFGSYTVYFISTKTVYKCRGLSWTSGINWWKPFTTLQSMWLDVDITITHSCEHNWNKLSIRTRNKLCMRHYKFPCTKKYVLLHCVHQNITQFIG